MASKKRAAKKKREPRPNSLPPMQRAFVEAYLGMKRPNATRAALKAGYSPKTARQQGQRLLTNVDISALIERRRAERLRKFHMGRDEILAIAAHVARGEMTDYVKWDEEGQTTWRQSDKLSAGERSAVKSFKRKRKVMQTPHGEIEEITLEIQLHDKLVALKMLGQEAGLFKDKVELTGKDGGPVEHRDLTGLTDDELAAEIARLQGKAGAPPPAPRGTT